MKEAQAFIGADEFGQTDLSFSIGDSPEVVVYCDESLKHRAQMESEAGDRPVDGRAADSEVLPAPDPKDVSSRIPARDYAVGDTIGGRFEVEEVLGSGGFSKVYRVRDARRGRGARAEAVRQRRRLRRSASRDRRAAQGPPPQRRQGHLGRPHRPGRVVPHHGVHRRRAARPTTPPARSTSATAKPSTSLSTCSTPSSPSTPTPNASTRSTRRSAKARSPASEYDELMSLSENALVHRDIKPQNIMLTRSGAKLLDFNIASRVGDPVKTVSGTPPYQPPDADLTRWDVSTDLFAVGVTLYELLCDGEHPYPNARPALDVKPRDPRQFRRDLNDDLADFLVRACAPERSTRFQTAVEMKAALASARSSP